MSDGFITLTKMIRVQSGFNEERWDVKSESIESLGMYENKYTEIHLNKGYEVVKESMDTVRSLIRKSKEESVTVPSISTGQSFVTLLIFRGDHRPNETEFNGTDMWQETRINFKIISEYTSFDIIGDNLPDWYKYTTTIITATPRIYMYAKKTVEEIDKMLENKGIQIIKSTGKSLRTIRRENGS